MTLPATAPKPAPVSAPSSALSPPHTIPLPPRLLVPFPAQTQADHLPVGTRVEVAQPLVTVTAGAAHVPLAPAAGMITAVRAVQLLDGRDATALEIEVDPDAVSAHSEAPPRISGDRSAPAPDLPT